MTSLLQELIYQKKVFALVPFSDLEPKPTEQIHPVHKVPHGLHFLSQKYHFTELLHGIHRSNRPIIFTIVMAEAFEPLRLQDVSVILYLDDPLFFAAPGEQFAASEYGSEASAKARLASELPETFYLPRKYFFWIIPSILFFFTSALTSIPSILTSKRFFFSYRREHSEAMLLLQAN